LTIESRFQFLEKREVGDLAFYGYWIIKISVPLGRDLENHDEIS
jgi:hypothetical protein